MKVSISLPDKDIAFIDRQIADLRRAFPFGRHSQGAANASAPMSLKREPTLQRWSEWDEEDEQVWDVTVGRRP